MRISATSRSSSVCDTLDANSFRSDDPRHGYDLIAAHDERPRLAGRTGDLCVDEHVLDLLRPSGEPVTGPPASYLKAWQVGRDSPAAPLHLSLQRDRRALDPDAVVLAHRCDAAAEVEPPRGRRRSEQLVELRRAFLREAQEVDVRSGVQRAQPREDLVADEAALRVGVRRVFAELEAVRAAVLLGPVAPDLDQRAHPPVLATWLDRLRVAAGDEPIEHRLELVGRGVPRRAQPVGREGGREIGQFLLRLL